jgi:hypothetical protein
MYSSLIDTCDLETTYRSGMVQRSIIPATQETEIEKPSFKASLGKNLGRL